MKREDLGQYFIRNGEIYEVVGYIDNPALTLRNINTGMEETVVIGSLESNKYNKLFSVPYEENAYNLSKATPVKCIYFENEED